MWQLNGSPGQQDAARLDERSSSSMPAALDLRRVTCIGVHAAREHSPDYASNLRWVQHLESMDNTLCSLSQCLATSTSRKRYLEFVPDYFCYQ